MSIVSRSRTQHAEQLARRAAVDESAPMTVMTRHGGTAVHDQAPGVDEPVPACEPNGSLNRAGTSGVAVSRTYRRVRYATTCKRCLNRRAASNGIRQAREAAADTASPP